MITTSSRSSTPRKLTPTEFPKPGKSKRADISESIDIDQPSGDFFLGIPATRTKTETRNDDSRILAVDTTSTDAPEFRHDGTAPGREQRSFSSDEGDLESGDERPPTTIFPGIRLLTGNPGETFEYENSGDFSGTESITEEDGESIDDADSSGHENEIQIEDAVVPTAPDATLATQKDCVRRKYIMYAAGCSVSILMMSITTMFFVRAYGPRDQPRPDVNPDFDWSVFDAFNRCARALGLDLTVDDKALIADLVASLRVSYGQQLAAVTDIGTLLECRSTGIEGLGGIFADFSAQLNALVNAASAAAGLSSPSACLIVLSLLYLFANGIA